MKITILFLSFLFFISCTKKIDTVQDPVFVELSKDQRANAIFAVMKMQLKQEGGAERILSLLNELVDDQKKRLKEESKVHAGIDVRCEVSDMKFNERNDLLNHKRQRFHQDYDQAVEDLSSYQDSLNVFKQRLVDFQGFSDQEEARHNDEVQNLQNSIDNYNIGLDRVNDALNEVKKWRTASIDTDLIQKKLELVSESYLQIKQVKITIPNSFLQLAQKDDDIKVRLSDWLLTILGEFQLSVENLNQILNNRTNEYNDLQKELADIIEELHHDIDWLRDTLQVSQRVKDNSESKLVFIEQLYKNNANLIELNTDYCNTQRGNFRKAVEDLTDNLNFLKTSRDYFRDNYVNLSNLLSQNAIN